MQTLQSRTAHGSLLKSYRRRAAGIHQAARAGSQQFCCLEGLLPGHFKLTNPWSLQMLCEVGALKNFRKSQLKALLVSFLVRSHIPKNDVSAKTIPFTCSARCELWNIMSTHHVWMHNSLQTQFYYCGLGPFQEGGDHKYVSHIPW